MTAFPPDLFAGRRFAVVGLGRNGLPVARALLAMGADVAAWDDRPEARASATGLTLRDLQQGGFAFDALVLSPGIPHRLPIPHPVAVRALEADVPILSDAELLFQAVRRAGLHVRFAGITGTNGKSTTTALLAHVLCAAGVPNAAGGNLGTPALALPLLPDHGVYVLEMSSYMLERLATLRFDVAAMLNLSPDHLDRHGNMAAYAAAKRAIFARQTADDLAVVGVEDADSRAMAAWLRDLPAPVVGVAGRSFELRNAPALPGTHNAQNAAAAFAVARFLGVPEATIRGAFTTFPGLPHRQQVITTIEGIAFINDSKATNADATARALACYDRIVWIAGGQAKEGGIEPLAPLFGRIARALLLGRDAPTLANTLTAHNVPYDIVGTLDAAVPAALPIARQTGATAVLLSPACASFDQFSGFDARGDRFVALATELACRRVA